MTAQPLLIPPALHHGSRVAIVTPSGVVKPEFVEGAVEALSLCDFEPVLSPHCNEQSPRRYGVIATAGTPQHRLDDLLWALTDPSIDAIFCARGGYGAVHLLPQLDLALIRRACKWLIGFSDITALHAAWAAAGVASIHGPMARHLSQWGCDDSCVQAMCRLLAHQPITIYSPMNELNRAGSVTAPLVGGNLAVMASLIGTQWDTLIRPGTILFIEDIGEEVYRVERTLLQLRNSGRLAHLAGLIAGRFTGYHDNPTADAMQHMIADLVSPYDYPLALDFPAGHIDYNQPLLLGPPATLTVNKNGVTRFESNFVEP